MILDDMIANGSLPAEKRYVVRNALLLKHVHQVRPNDDAMRANVSFHSMKKTSIDICTAKSSKNRCRSRVPWPSSRETVRRKM